MEGHYPASRGKRNVEKDQRSGPEGAEIEVEQRENDQQRQRDSHDQSSTGALQLLELPAPGNGISGRQCDLPVDQTLGFRNESSEIAAADVRLDADAALRVFPADLGGPLLIPDIGELAEGNKVALGVADLEIPDRVRRGSLVLLKANLKGVAAVAVHDLSHHL